MKTNVFNFLSHLSRASSVASSSAVWKACKALCGDKLARRRMSKVVFVAAFPYLNVDVHALFPGNLLQAQSLSDDIFQLELGLVSRKDAILLWNEWKLDHLDHFGRDEDVSVRHAALVLRLAHGRDNRLVVKDRLDGILHKH